VAAQIGEVISISEIMKNLISDFNLAKEELVKGGRFFF